MSKPPDRQINQQIADILGGLTWSVNDEGWICFHGKCGRLERAVAASKAVTLMQWIQDILEREAITEPSFHEQLLMANNKMAERQA